jgi:hypothetical protein
MIFPKPESLNLLEATDRAREIGEQKLRQFWKKLLNRSDSQRGRPALKVERSQQEFRRRYPHYRMGTGTYGIPLVHGWHDGTTLVISNLSCVRTISRNSSTMLAHAPRVANSR